MGKAGEKKNKISAQAIVKIAAGMSLKSMMAAGLSVFAPNFEPARTLRALNFFDNGNLRQLAPRIQALLNHEVSAIKLEELIVLAAHEGLTKQEAR